MFMTILHGSGALFIIDGACALLMDLMHGSGASSMVLVHESCPYARFTGIVYSIPLETAFATIFAYPAQKNMHKQHEIYMANANSSCSLFSWYRQRKGLTMGVWL